MYFSHDQQGYQVKVYTMLIHDCSWSEPSTLYFLLRQTRIDFTCISKLSEMLVWGSCGKTKFLSLESLHVREAKIIYKMDWCTPGKEVLKKAKWKKGTELYFVWLLQASCSQWYSSVRSIISATYAFKNSLRTWWYWSRNLNEYIVHNYVCSE